MNTALINSQLRLGIIIQLLFIQISFQLFAQKSDDKLKSFINLSLQQSIIEPIYPTLKEDKKDSLALRYYNNGFEFLQTEQFERAVSEWSKYISVKPANFEGYYFRGLCLCGMGKKNLSFADFDRSLKKEYNGYALFGKALCYMDYLQPDSALNLLNQAEKTAAQLVSLSSMKAWCLLRLGDSTNAGLMLKTAFEKDTSWYPYFVRAELRYNSEDLNGTIEDINTIMKKGEKIPEMLAFRGLCEIQLEDSLGAMTDFLHSLDLKPCNNKTLMYMAMIYEAAEDQEKADQYMEKMISCNPENPITYFLRAIIYEEAGDDPKAISDISKAMQLDSNNIEYYQFRLNLYTEIENNAKALADINTILRLSPDNAAGCLMRAEAWNYIRNYTEEMKEFDKLCEMAPTAANFMTRGEFKIDRKDFKSAVEDFSKAISLDPSMAEAYRRRGSAKFVLGDKSGGCADIRKAASMGDNEAKTMVDETCKYYK